MSDIILSILVPTYGHEKYIKETLDSILMQKTKYKYEIIVGEDASPDNTREILRIYEKKFPDKFVMVYRDVNAGGYGTGNCLDLGTRAKGKYITFVEGDDFWISDTKIEQQVDFLEKNPDYVAIGCNTIIVDGESKIIDEKYPECKDEEYTLEHYRKGILPGQTACMMYRKEVWGEIVSDVIWNFNPIPGDRIFFLGIITKGKIYCIQKPLSAYRHIVHSGTSYSATCKKDFYRELDWYSELIDFASRLNNINAEYAAEGRYFAFLFFEGLIKRKCSIGKFLKLWFGMKYPFRVALIKLLDYGMKNQE